jgi:hypothetical protein
VACRAIKEVEDMAADRPDFDYANIPTVYHPRQSVDGFHYTFDKDYLVSGKEIELIMEDRSLIVWRKDNSDRLDSETNGSLVEFDSLYSLLLTGSRRSDYSADLSLKAIYSGGITFSRRNMKTMFHEPDYRPGSFSDVSMQTFDITRVDYDQRDDFVPALKSWAAHHGIRVVQDYRALIP